MFVDMFLSVNFSIMISCFLVFRHKISFELRDIERNIQRNNPDETEIEHGIPMIQHLPDQQLSLPVGSVRRQSFIMEDNTSPTGTLAWVGFACTLFSLAALCVSFASPFWVQTWPNSFNKFRNIGLWSVCMDNYMHWKDEARAIYSECWWVFNPAQKYYKLRDWILTPWFMTCQVMVSGCLVISIIAVLVAIFVFLHFCPIINHRYYQTYGMFTVAALMFLDAMISFVCALVFGVMCQDWAWMPRPDMNFLSWGFGFYIISGIIAAVAGIAYFMESSKVYDELLRREDDEFKATLEMSGYIPQAPSTYGSYPPFYGPQGSFDKSQMSQSQYSDNFNPSYPQVSASNYPPTQGYGQYDPSYPTKA